MHPPPAPVVPKPASAAPVRDATPLVELTLEEKKEAKRVEQERKVAREREIYETERNRREEVFTL